jgi:ribonucleoside-diphosphate reductase beta chain
MKDRINKSLVRIGIDKVFIVDTKLVKSMKWFDEEIQTTSHDDFFAKRPVDYSKFTQAVSVDSLF